MVYKSFTWQFILDYILRRIDVDIWVIWEIFLSVCIKVNGFMPILKIICSGICVICVKEYWCNSIQFLLLYFFFSSFFRCRGNWICFLTFWNCRNGCANISISLSRSGFLECHWIMCNLSTVEAKLKFFNFDEALAKFNPICWHPPTQQPNFQEKQEEKTL